MAKVMLHSVVLDDEKLDPWAGGACRMLKQSARQDTFGVHQLTDDPEAAELIIFVEIGAHGLFAERVRRHPLFLRYREKCFLFDPGDYALPLLPGIFASLRQRVRDPERTRTGYYLREDENPYVRPRPLEEAEHLGVFVGSLVNHPVRAALAKLDGDRFVVKDTSSFALRLLRTNGGDEKDHFWKSYADAIASGVFSLCPRGVGPGSIRLFESMCMGRAPVIISDEWVFPERVDWSSCSIVVAEKDVGELPDILGQNRHRAAELALNARKEWERNYAPEVRFHWLAEDCLGMLHSRSRPERIASRMAWIQGLSSLAELRRFASSKKQFYKEERRLVI